LNRNGGSPASSTDLVPVWEHGRRPRGLNGALHLVLLAASATGCGQVQTEVGAITIPQEAAVCDGDLSNVGTGDFRMSFQVATTQTGWVAVANQRAECAPSVFWDVRIADGGFVYAEVDDGAHYTAITSTGPKINDGAPHAILVVRASGTLTVYVDGGASGSQASGASLGPLPPLRLGTDVCVGAPGDDTAALIGGVTDACVSRSS
jgi:hypothetical protein